jgi:branched-chain amino acid transport system substrate-binding protein
MTSRSRVKASLLGISAAAMLAALPASAQMKVGALLPMTGSGASVGAASQLGLRMAFAEINAAGGILGQQVQMVQADDATDATQAVNEAKRLVLQEKVKVMFGPIFSPPTLAVASAVAKTETGVLYWSLATAGALTPDLARTIFSYGPSSQAIAETLVDYAVNTRKSQSIGYLGDDAQQSLLTFELIKEAMKKANRELIVTDQYALNSPDVTPQLLNLRRRSPDLVILMAQSPIDTATVMKNLEQVGWNVPMIGNNGAVVNYPVMARNAGPTAIKNLVGGVSPKAFAACPSVPPGQAPYPQFVARLKAFEANINPQLGITTVVQLYDQAHLTKKVAEAIGTTDGMKMTEHLEQNSSKYSTIVAPVMNLSPTNHFLATASALTMAEDMGNVRPDGLYKQAGC